MIDPSSPHPYALSRDEGKSIWFLDTLMTVKAAGEQTGNAFTLVEQVLPPGFSPSPHTHAVEEEAFYILEGIFTFVCGGRTFKASPGSFVFLPRGVMHVFTVEGSTPARVLQITSPSGFERFAEEVGEPTRAPTLPPPRRPNVEELLTVAAKYRIEILGPPPKQFAQHRGAGQDVPGAKLR